MPTTLEAILFDVNGTLRIRVTHETTQRAAFARLHELLDKDEIDWEELARRQQAYRKWSRRTLTQLTEAEIWSRWMLPEFPPEQIEPASAELMLAWSERKGHTIPAPGAERTLVTLRERGYRLGLISNSMSTLDIPRSLEAFGWADYFEVVILSSILKILKPSPEPFREAARRLNLWPAQCAYVGNRVSKDIPGCKQAGFALGLVVEPANTPRPSQQEPNMTADIVIHDLSDLLDIFTVRVRA